MEEKNTLRGRRNARQVIGLLTLLLALFLTVSGDAWAQPGEGQLAENPEEVPGAIDEAFGDSDIGMTLLDGRSGIGFALLEAMMGAQLASVFGGGESGTENGVFVALLATTSLVAMAIVPIVFAYIGLSGLFLTMQHGELFGRSWSSTWVTLRTAGGMAFAAPTPLFGISAVQMAILSIAILSNGIGNFGASVIVAAGGAAPYGGDAVSEELSAVFGSPPEHVRTQDISAAFGNIAGHATCVDVMTRMGAQGPEITRQCGGASGHDTEAGEMSEVEIQDICRYDGERQYPCEAVMGAQRDAHQRIRALSEEFDGDLSGPVPQADLKTIADDFRDDVADAFSQSGVFGWQDGEFGAIEQNPMDDLSNPLENSMAYIQEVGWPGLGFWYDHIGSQMDMISGLTTGGDANWSANEIAGNTREAQRTGGAAARNQLAAQNAVNQRRLESEEAGLVSRGIAEIANIGSRVSGDFSAAGEGGSDYISDRVYDWYAESFIYSQSGIEALRSVGATTIGAVLGGAVSIDLLANNVSGIGNARDAVSNVVSGSSSLTAKLAMSAAVVLGTILFIVSAFILFVLPKLPIAFMTFMTIEWLVWVVVLSVAAPLWMILHMLPQGEGMVPQQAIRGYQVIFFILLFPLLVVTGFGISMLVMNVAVPFVGMMLLGYAPTGVLGGAGNMVALPVTMTILMMMVGYAAMKLMLTLPYQFTEMLGISIGGSQGFSSEANPNNMSAQAAAPTAAQANVIGGAGKG